MERDFSHGLKGLVGDDELKAVDCQIHCDVYRRLNVRRKSVKILVLAQIFNRSCSPDAIPISRIGRRDKAGARTFYAILVGNIAPKNLVFLSAKRDFLINLPPPYLRRHITLSMKPRLQGLEAFLYPLEDGTHV